MKRHSVAVDDARSPAAEVRTASSRLGDWAGFLCFAGLAALTLYRTPQIGITLLPTILQEVGVAVVFLTREPSRDAIRTVGARVAAYVGSFIVLLYIQAADTFHPEWLAPTSVDLLQKIGGGLWIGGIGFALVSLWWLRRSFAIEPAARHLITGGPYRFTRHPVYSGYVLYYLGTLCIYPSAAYAVTLAIWAAATAIRIRYEETVLRRAFPDEYAAYSRRVGMFAPSMRPTPASQPLPQSS